jgi:signal transduction histidine kinase
LLLITALACACTLTAGLGAMIGATRKSVEGVQDQRLEELAEVILTVAEANIGKRRDGELATMVTTKTPSGVESDYRYQLWTAHGNLVMRSELAPDSPLFGLHETGFHTVPVGNEYMRVLALRSLDGSGVVQVGEYVSDRQAELRHFVLLFIKFVLPPCFAILLLTAWLLRRALRAVDVSAADLASRGPLDLAPIRVANPPTELVPLLTSTNRLFERISKAMSLERGFTAMAAHELRTPLSGLRAQAQIAATAESKEELADALAMVMSGVDRSAHLIEQMLDLARLESMASVASPQRQPVNVAEVQSHVMADLQGLARLRGIEVSCDCAVAELHVSSAGLSLLLTNLLSNALRYTPTGGRVHTATYAEGRDTVLIVDDSGPGIPASLRARALDRFERLGKSDNDGVGLGLAIVHSVVLAHHARIELQDSPLGGLRVQIRFPAPAG